MSYSESDSGAAISADPSAELRVTIAAIVQELLDKKDDASGGTSAGPSDDAAAGEGLK